MKQETLTDTKLLKDKVQPKQVDWRKVQIEDRAGLLDFQMLVEAPANPAKIFRP